MLPAPLACARSGSATRSNPPHRPAEQLQRDLFEWNIASLVGRRDVPQQLVFIVDDTNCRDDESCHTLYCCSKRSNSLRNHTAGPVSNRK